MKKIIPLFIFVALALTVGATANQKVDVCHVKGNNEILVLNISINALQAHLNHGDALFVNGVCQWEEEPPTPIEFITAYYLPIMFQFFDWGQYCDPRCPLGVDASGNIIQSYP